MIERDTEGRCHVVALSGGKDSTCMAIGLAERNPSTPYTYICTPTGDELPEMFAHWRSLSERLGKQIIPIIGGTLRSICDDEECLPNWRMRFCTRRLKIEPFRAWVLAQSPCVVYVGLRADEEGREGTNYDTTLIEQRYPLREWGFDLAAVLRFLEERAVLIPERTDCASCFFQTLGEWYRLWLLHPEKFADAERLEERFGHTLRSPGRDSWPAALKDLRAEFERGRLPRGVTVDGVRAATCRTCTL